MNKIGVLYSCTMQNLKRKLIDILPRKLLFDCHAIFSRVRSLKYNGTAVYCPNCERTFSKFLPNDERFPILDQLEVVGQAYHEAGYCPRCFSADRDRLVMFYLNDHLRLFSPDCKIQSMLHIAPEYCLHRRIASSNIPKYHTGNLYPWIAKEVIDITSIPHPDDSFDLFMANHVLEHVPDDEKALAEIYRILKPGGQAIIQVPLTYKESQTHEDKNALSWSDEEREKAFGQRDHVRIYAYEDYKTRISNAGFTVEPVDWQEAKFPYSEQATLNPRELLIIARKT